MRNLLLAAVLMLPGALAAQSGRHYLRTPRTPVTPAATPAPAAVVDASAAPQRRIEPLRRLRSGRAWSLFHFARRPLLLTATVTAADASARPELRRTMLWGRSVRDDAR